MGGEKKVMKQPECGNYVVTIKERCRTCYTCVRECPAKAIRIVEGQAEVLSERCIGCGNCVRVCSQNAKVIKSTVDQVNALIEGSAKVSVCLAPSFPAAFPDTDFRKLLGMIEMLGFDYIQEVALGADLVAAEYVKLLTENKTKQFISTTCPAIVTFVQRYFPELVPNLAPIVSPMVATAIAVREMYGEDLKVVFLGPCIAKKGEHIGNETNGNIDAVLTFTELKQMFDEKGLSPETVKPREFDPPHPNLGALFPVARGMLQAANLDEDLVAQEVIAASGRTSFVEAIKEFSQCSMHVNLLEVLCCEGCIMGAGMPCELPMFSRRSLISKYVRQRLLKLDKEQWRRDMARYASLNFSRDYIADDQRVPVPSKEELINILEQLGKEKPEDELNCGACGYDTCVEHATAIFKGLAEVEMCLPNTIEKLNFTIDELAVSNDRLAQTQQALLQSEKLASMGQLAAGIAHELNNPLGVVLMYAHILLDESAKLVENSGNGSMKDLQVIVEQADRCKKIVSGLLHFARQNKVLKQPVDLKDLIQKSLNTVFIPDTISVEIEHNITDPIVHLDKDQVIQVLTNLISNACGAMQEKGKLIITTSDKESSVEIRVKDTGTGIPENIREKIFEPFFTTKGIGEGTGLGLAVTYGIVKMHSGDIRLESNTDPAKGDTGTTFIISLPHIEEAKIRTN